MIKITTRATLKLVIYLISIYLQLSLVYSAEQKMTSYFCKQSPAAHIVMITVCTLFDLIISFIISSPSFLFTLLYWGWCNYMCDDYHYWLSYCIVAFTTLLFSQMSYAHYLYICCFFIFITGRISRQFFSLNKLATLIYIALLVVLYKQLFLTHTIY